MQLFRVISENTIKGDRRHCTIVEELSERPYLCASRVVDFQKRECPGAPVVQIFGKSRTTAQQRRAEVLDLPPTWTVGSALIHELINSSSITGFKVHLK